MKQRPTCPQLHSNILINEFLHDDLDGVEEAFASPAFQNLESDKQCQRVEQILRYALKNDSMRLFAAVLPHAHLDWQMEAMRMASKEYTHALPHFSPQLQERAKVIQNTHALLDAFTKKDLQQVHALLPISDVTYNKHMVLSHAVGVLWEEGVKALLDHVGHDPDNALLWAVCSTAMQHRRPSLRTIAKMVLPKSNPILVIGQLRTHNTRSHNTVADWLENIETRRQKKVLANEVGKKAPAPVFKRKM